MLGGERLLGLDGRWAFSWTCSRLQTSEEVDTNERKQVMVR